MKAETSGCPNWRIRARRTFRVYLNGKLVNERGFFSLDTIGGHPMHLGAAWHTARGALNFFSGSVAQIRVYDYTRSPEEISATAAAKLFVPVKPPASPLLK